MRSCGCFGKGRAGKCPPLRMATPSLSDTTAANNPSTLVRRVRKNPGRSTDCAMAAVAPVWFNVVDRSRLSRGWEPADAVAETQPVRRAHGSPAQGVVDAAGALPATQKHQAGNGVVLATPHEWGPDFLGGHPVADSPQPRGGGPAPNERFARCGGSVPAEGRPKAMAMAVTMVLAVAMGVEGGCRVRIASPLPLQLDGVPVQAVASGLFEEVGWDVTECP